MIPASRARFASNGPASASASTFTITMCLRCSQHASTWPMPAAGEPVASITMSTSGSAIIRALSSKRRTEPIAASAQPTRCSASLARAGLRSAIAVMRTPGVCRACDRYIEPNFPAPIRPMRSGLPRASRSFNKRCRFTFALRGW